MSDTRNIVARILDIIAESQASPDIDLTMRGGKLTLTADLGASAGPAKRSAVAPTGAADVTPEAILAALERRKAGMNLANLAKLVGVAKKMAVKPLVERMIADGRVERATGGKFRLPGRVKRGRKPGSGRKATVIKPVVAAPKPAALVPKKHQAVKPVKKAARPAAPMKKAAASPVKSKPVAKPKKAKSMSRPVAVRKPASAKVASTPVTTEEPPAPADPPVAEVSATDDTSQEEQPA